MLIFFIVIIQNQILTFGISAFWARSGQNIRVAAMSTDEALTDRKLLYFITDIYRWIGESRVMPLVKELVGFVAIPVTKV